MGISGGRAADDRRCRYLHNGGGRAEHNRLKGYQVIVLTLIIGVAFGVIITLFITQSMFVDYREYDESIIRLTKDINRLESRINRED
jgi:hypothetical protein